MPTLGDIYWKFGFASEAAQLLETELGNLLFIAGAIESNLLETKNPVEAVTLLNRINRKTLGQLMTSLQKSDASMDELNSALKLALHERNRLSHSFYRQHNFRRNSEEGRVEMMRDLDSIHETILDAYKFVMRLSGVDLENHSIDKLPTQHLDL